MSAPNFHNKNANKIFAHDCEDEFSYDDLISNIQAELKEGEDTNEHDKNSLRSYGGTIIKQIFENFGKWDVTIDIIIRGGYYSGCNLDWNVKVEDVPEYNFYEWGEEEFDMLPQYIKSFVDGKIKKIEKVFTDLTTPLICLGIFSNGEAVYKKAKN